MAVTRQCCRKFCPPHSGASRWWKFEWNSVFDKLLYEPTVLQHDFSGYAVMANVRWSWWRGDELMVNLKLEIAAGYGVASCGFTMNSMEIYETLFCVPKLGTRHFIDSIHFYTPWHNRRKICHQSSVLVSSFLYFYIPLPICRCFSTFLVQKFCRSSVGIFSPCNSATWSRNIFGRARGKSMFHFIEICRLIPFWHAICMWLEFWVFEIPRLERRQSRVIDQTTEK